VSATKADRQDPSRYGVAKDEAERQVDGFVASINTLPVMNKKAANEAAFLRWGQLCGAKASFAYPRVQRCLDLVRRRGSSDRGRAA